MTEGPAEPAGLHAFADMFFTLGAMALFAVAMVAGAANHETSLAGLVLEASKQGVTCEGRATPLNHLLDDALLRERLAQARARSEPVTVIIDPDGLESAFVLESLLGGILIRQRRVAWGEAAAP